MTRVVIATAGGFGRELAAYARDAGFEVAGFLHDLDDYPGSLDDVELGAPLLGPIAAYAPREGELVAVGLGDVGPRRELGERLLARGGRLATIVHPTAWVAPSAALGAGVAIAPFAYVGPDARIGDLALLNTYASVGHDTVVGRGCVLSPYAVANGRVTLEDEVFLATHAVVTPRRRVGRSSAVSAGSVVLADVAPRSLATGNPARARELYAERAMLAQAPGASVDDAATRPPAVSGPPAVSAHGRECAPASPAPRGVAS